MKSVFLGFPVHGHINPGLSVVRELVRRGDEVTYYGAPAFRDQIRDTGARYREYGSTFLKDPGRHVVELSHLPHVMMRSVESVMETELPAVMEGGYDYLIHDAMAPWGMCLAELTGLPAISSITTLALNKRVVSLARGLHEPPFSPRQLAAKAYAIVQAIRVRKRIRQRFRIRHPHLMELYFSRERLNLVYTSRQFQPFAESFDESFRFVGPCLQSSVTSRPEASEPGSSGSHVYVSMGSPFNSGFETYRSIFRVLKKMPYPVVASVGHHPPLSDIGEVPEKWVVRPFVPQLDGLPGSILFIGRGDMNSVNEALCCGVPLLIIPHLVEQAIIGQRIVELGAGLVLSPRHVTEERLRSAVNELLFNPSFAAEARSLGRELLACGSERHAADEIFDYVHDARYSGSSVSSKP